ncbi:MAG: tRNA (adenosine(37)-N6)-dimethylallyltransferase MiaA [Candidatus Pacebacteria bacterium]|nr:tRNA (adenosine(37)-N6)-dimethylallyltransferase MiaA [Candidatus Paceibacterota bacterium]
MKDKKLQKLIVILGATATGKTDLGIWLAKKYNGEIVSADSRLVYREMNIGTAKPKNESTSTFESGGIKHYMIDIVSLKKTYNAAIYKKEAIKKIKLIQKKGKIPFLVGGTGLYIDGIVKNIDFPEIKPDEKTRLELESKTLEELIDEYKKLDPVGAKNIDCKNKRRLVRAIEVCKLTGKSFWENRCLEEPVFDCLEIGIKVKKEELLKRIEKRVLKMVKNGLRNEAEKLIKKYGNIPPLQTIGYQEWRGSFGKEISKKELKEIEERIVINTNKFAKRQMTWLKRDKEINWIENKKEAEKMIKEFLKK